MTEIPYVNVTGKVSKIFEAIKNTGVPDKITQKWLESIGFTGKGDRKLIGLLKMLGFLDASGKPTDLYTLYRDNSKSKAVMASSIKATYSDLFNTYPDAHVKDDEALRNFFRTKSQLGEDAVRFMVQTFKNLVPLADFSTEVEDLTIAAVPSSGIQTPRIQVGAAAGRTATLQPLIININIELALPETKDKDVYENLFSSLRKNILSTGEKDK